MKLTRRQLAIALAPAAALVRTAAAQPAPVADAELRAARERVRANGATLTRHALPMAVEPAFQFKV